MRWIESAKLLNVNRGICSSEIPDQSQRRDGGNSMEGDMPPEAVGLRCLNPRDEGNHQTREENYGCIQT